MEKLIVKIGLCSEHFEKKNLNLNSHNNVLWLAETLEISRNRSQKLIDSFKNESSTSGRYANVVLSYRQLARYTAKRQVEELNKYWKYPLVLEHIESSTSEPQFVVELRPGYRAY